MLTMDALMVPPLSLSWPSKESVEAIDWMSPQKVDSQYIAKICACVERNFPQRTTKWGSSPYPAETLKRFVYLGPKGSLFYEKEISQLFPTVFKLLIAYSMAAGFRDDLNSTKVPMV
ncbi:hypothetical protein ACJBU6_07298 [Exserohilum turcicum]